MKSICLTLIFVFQCSFCLMAQAPANNPAPCSSEEYRQFDFWIGDWNVYAKDKLVGTNNVEQILDACVIMENWIGAGGSRGKSFNTYKATTKTWHQTWVDNVGSTIHFSGKFEEGVMRMTAKDISVRDGNPVLYTLDFTPNDDGSVRQEWKASKDEGKTWSVLFDGKYVKKE